MKIKASAGLIAGGLVAGAAGALISFIRTTDEYGNTTFPFIIFGVLVGVLGAFLLIWGVYQFVRNIDTAVATYVDGPEAAARLHAPRDLRLRDDTDATA